MIGYDVLDQMMFVNIYGLTQDWGNSIGNVLKLLQSWVQFWLSMIINDNQIWKTIY